MSWLFSQALVAEYLADTCSDGELSAQLNVMPTPHKFWHKDKMMDHSNLSRFGLTLKRLTESRGVELLTLYLEDSRVRTSVRKVAGGGYVMANEADSGRRWQGLLAKYDPALCLWKIAQCSLLADLEQCLEIWPRWGSMRNGECYQQPMLALRTSESASGLLPTPMASDWKGGTSSIRKDTGKQRLDQFRDWCKSIHGLTYPIPEHSEAMMGWPIGWSDLKLLVMGKSQNAMRQHSLCCEKG